MTKQELAVLNEEFGMISTLDIREVSGVPVIFVSTPDAHARIALQGGQVLSWQPAGHSAVLWTSKAAVYQTGRGVRGGVPVCWPWFGAGDEGKPAHGFVRTRMWQLRETNWLGNQLIIRLGIRDDEETRKIWNHSFDLELQVVLGRTLVMRLVSRNTGSQSMTLTEGLHTYFNVGDIANTEVTGLARTLYLDKVHDMDRHIQSGAVSFTGETDRVYLDTDSICVIHDREHDRRIGIRKLGSLSTVIWNPWRDKAAGFTDMQPDEYKQMLCVETCNAVSNQVVVDPGKQHVMEAEILVEAGTTRP